MMRKAKEDTMLIPTECPTCKEPFRRNRDQKLILFIGNGDGFYCSKECGLVVQREITLKAHEAAGMVC